MALHQRLLRDIAELQTKPYPNISLIPNDDTVTEACLILTPNGGRPIHLTVTFTHGYPLKAPQVTIESKHVQHPNIFGSYICASILNTEEGYTSAYTLKGIAIQLLSFFSSERIEQDHGGSVDLTAYRINGYRKGSQADYHCDRCGLGNGSLLGSKVGRSQSQHWKGEANDEPVIEISRGSFPTLSLDPPQRVITPKTRRHGPPQLTKTRATIQPALPLVHASSSSQHVRQGTSAGLRLRKVTRQLADLPDEIILLICNELDTEELLVFARAWQRVGGEAGIVTRFDLIRTRELECFCLKRCFSEQGVQLGVGVNVIRKGRQGTLESEFDLISLQAYKEFGIRRSVQGRRFQYWLPLPISPRHYESVKEEVSALASQIATTANMSPPTPVTVIYHFMNDIVVKLSQEASKTLESSDYRRETPQSTLQHASEKAVESYFHLFHLLLCLATPAVVRSANSNIQAFLAGQTSKATCPNLGHLLVAVLISDYEMTQELVMAIIKETVTRNVVWLLDARGAGMAELSYMEASAVSEYRLQRTFEASKTSYRLLMFLNLLRLTTHQSSVPRKTLTQLKEEMFDRHGAPPKGAATRLANDIKRIHAVNSFPDFLRVMGVQKMPTAAEFTAFLRRSIEQSVLQGYSVWGISQEDALTLRLSKDPNVQIRMSSESKPEWSASSRSSRTFFPNQGRR